MPAPSTHPFSNDEATRLLERALNRAKEVSGTSLTEAASAIGISKAALSHMANGRAPIPIDRAADLAHHLHLEPRPFLMAVLHQRHPEAMAVIAGADFSSRRPQDQQIDWVLSRPIAELSEEQITIIREVARDARPRERWLEVGEVPAVKTIRRLRPEGMMPDDVEWIELALKPIDATKAGEREHK